MNEELDVYYAYMLRLWRVQSKGRWQWHVSLESPHTGERLLFSSLEQFFAFLCEQCSRQIHDTSETPET